MPFFKPLLAGASLSGRLLACLGAALGIAATIWICGRLPLAAADLPVIVAPLGASAVLVFAVPTSPLAQPWPVLGGNVISTIIGVAAFDLIPDTAIAAGIAVGGAILVMSLLQCLHPPGGAAALTAVIGGPAIHDAGYAFALMPVATNSIALVVIAMLYHRATRHAYPRAQAPAPALGTPLQATDIDRALADMDESFDISRADLDALLAHAERHATARTSTARVR
ncbi:HPP family protein [Sphingomonas radiodurans]|uniref:HPP family protein n=1 Tax=Sphingomonas radiodurans TaxID=2890321 RepID=UPI001E5D6332|nr:HPP family protein [Sphingomonas radiodurans]WBH16041.1 HPP family protein [Sphingomonas radiodurans]